MKRRGVSSQFCARYGELEPVAYLLAWARAGVLFDSSKDHIGWSPARSDVGDAIKDVV